MRPIYRAACMVGSCIMPLACAEAVHEKSYAFACFWALLSIKTAIDFAVCEMKGVDSK